MIKSREKYNKMHKFSLKSKKFYSSVAVILLLAQSGLPAFADVTSTVDSTSNSSTAVDSTAPSNVSDDGSNASNDSTNTSDSGSSSMTEGASNSQNSSSNDSTGNVSDSSVTDSKSSETQNPSTTTVQPKQNSTNKESKVVKKVEKLSPETSKAIQKSAVEYTDTIPTISSIVPDNTIQSFIGQIGEQSRVIARDKGIYASVMIAQAILESGSGNSLLASQSHNLFGVKGSYQGASTSFNTLEQKPDGSSYTISAQFAVYPSTTESLIQYADLIASNYKASTKEKAANFEEAIKAIKAGGYATDKDYVSKIENIIKTYGLTDYDYDTNYAQAQFAPVTSETTLATTFDTNSNKKSDGKGVAGIDYEKTINPVTNTVAETVKGVDSTQDTTVRLLGYSTSKLGSKNYTTENLISETYLKGLNIKLGDNISDGTGIVANTTLVPKDESLIPGDIVYYTSATGGANLGLYTGNGYIEQVVNKDGKSIVDMTSLSGVQVTAVRRVVEEVAKTKDVINWEATIFKNNQVQPTNAVLKGRDVVVPESSENPYPTGQCTAYVWQYVYDNSNKTLALPPVLGNGQDWVGSLVAAGYKADGKPHVGDIVSFAGGSFGSAPQYGHVAVVMGVNPDGSFNIAEGNYLGIWGHVRTDLIPNASTTFVSLSK